LNTFLELLRANREELRYCFVPVEVFDAKPERKEGLIDDLLSRGSP
jgi:hypothetical protein